MNIVVQEEVGGCGIACAAMLANKNYPEARRIAASMNIVPNNPRLWSETGPIRNLLESLDVKVARTRRPFECWGTLPDCALLATKWHLEKGVPHWHWAIFVREMGEPVVLDPAMHLKHHRRTDLGRIRPRWYLKISSPV